MAAVDFSRIPRPASMRSRHISTVDYSADVFFGKARDDGTSMPGRPWFWSAFEAFDLAAEIAKGVRSPDGIEKGFRNAAFAFAVQVQEELESPKWDWDRDTVRSSGQTVGSPRDIIDTGALADGQRYFVAKIANPNVL